MAEYISREKVLALGYWHGEHPDFDNPNPDGVDAVDVSDIEAIPAADVVEVARCKDCTDLGAHLQDGRYSCKIYALPYCRLDDFCSYGRKRHE